MPVYLTPSEAAARLRVTGRWIRYLCKRGQLRHVVIGDRRVRIAESDLAAFISSRTK